MAVSKRLRYEVFRRDNHTCVYCGRSAPDVKLQPDHVVPEALGGRTEPANLVTACEDCNAGKSATPPDAATVESTSQSAIRWAGAMRAAADAALADLDAREKAREEFLKKWNSWTVAGETLPLPGTWADSVDRFLAAGLPMRILMDCVDRAMSKPKIKAHDLFRYMCGIAWSRVTELQKAAQAVADEAPPTSVGSPASANSLAAGRAHFAKELLDEHLHDDEQARFVEAARAVREDGDFPQTGDAIETDAAYEAFSAFVVEHGELRTALLKLLESLPPEDVRLCQEMDKKEHQRYLGDDPQTEVSHLAGTVRWISHLRNFQALPQAERDEWREGFARAHGIPPESVDVMDLVDHIRFMDHRGRFALDGMCVRSGEHGAMCPQRAAYILEIEDCRPCKSEERETCGRHAMCLEHATEIIDGKFVRKGEDVAVVASRITELEGAS